jgi:hypothetical protein
MLLVALLLKAKETEGARMMQVPIFHNLCVGQTLEQLQDCLHYAW